MAARAHILAILTTIFTVGIMDRQILPVLFEALKREFEPFDARRAAQCIGLRPNPRLQVP